MALRWRPRPAEAAAPWFTGTPSGAARRQSPCHGDAGGEPAPRKGQTEIAVRLGDASRPAGHLTGPHANTLTRCLKVSRSDTEIHGKGQAITEQHPQRRPAARTHGEPPNLSGKGPADSEPHHPSNEKQRKHNEARRRRAGVGAPQGHRAPRQPSRHCCSPELQTHGSRFLWDSSTQDLWEHPTPLAPPKRLFSWSLPSQERVPLSFQALEPEAMELPLVPPCLALPARPS